MNNKTLSILSYVTIIGWLISFFQYKDAPKNSLVSYHLRQGFGIFIVIFIFNIVLSIVTRIVPALGLLGLVGFVLSLIFIIMGIINAANEQEKPVPLIGHLFVGKFNFIP